MKTQNRVFWAVGTLGAVILLPPIILLSMLGFGGSLLISLDMFPSVFSAVPSIIFTTPDVSATTLFITLLCQWSILVLLTLRLTQQLRKAGESAFKTLLARPSLPSS